MAYGMIYDMYIWHIKSLKTTGTYASCNIPTSLSRSLFVGWIYFGSYISVSNTGNFSKNPCFHTKLCTVYAFILIVSCLLVTQIWTLKPGDVKDFPANVGFSRLYVSCFSILPWCHDVRKPAGVDSFTFGRCPTAPRSRSKHAWRSWKGNWARVAARGGRTNCTTVQGINISHLGKRKIIDSKCHFWWDMLVPWRVTIVFFLGDRHLF